MNLLPQLNNKFEKENKNLDMLKSRKKNSNKGFCEGK